MNSKPPQAFFRRSGPFLTPLLTPLFTPLLALLSAGCLAALLTACVSPLGAALSLVPWTPLLSTALSARDGDPLTRKQLNELQVKGDWPGVIRLAETYLKPRPNDPDWLLILGYARLENSEYAAAAETLVQVTRLNPEDIDAWNLLAAAQRLQGREDEAQKTLAHALSVDPSSPVTPYLLGEGAREAGRLDRATAFYKQSLQLDEEYAPSWYGLGLCFIAQKRPDDLKDVLGALRRLDTGLAADLQQRARVAGK